MKSISGLKKTDEPITEEDAHAVKALFAGIASEGQQKAIVKLLMSKLCDVDGDCFSDDQRKTDFALGQRYVGLQLHRLSLIP